MSTAPHVNVRGRWLSSFLPGRLSPPRAGRGISSIELAVVIAVTLVMVALAVAAYRTYVVRQEVKASVAAIGDLQKLVTDAFARTGIPPSSERDLGLETLPRHRYIDAVAIANGRIELRFGNDADESLDGQSLFVTPFETMEGEVLWLCGNRRPDVGLYPLGLFAGAPPPPTLVTTVEPRYLPTECR